MDNDTPIEEFKEKIGKYAKHNKLKVFCVLIDTKNPFINNHTIQVSFSLPEKLFLAKQLEIETERVLHKLVDNKVIPFNLD